MSKTKKKAGAEARKAAIKAFSREVLRLYNDKQLPRASAAMSYYLTMTFFPLIICLYALFGQSYSTAVKLLDYVRGFLTPDAAGMIDQFLMYLSEEGGGAITVIAITFLVSSASASMRTLIGTINEIQGKRRFRTLVNFLMSLVMAVGLLVAFYFAFIALLTGDSFVAFLSSRIPQLGNITDWYWARFLFLGGLMLLVLWGIFALLRPGRSPEPVFPGALLSTAAIVIMSAVFSAFIGASSRYQLIYGSLASIILMMLWLFLTCQMIFAGACVNAALGWIKRRT